MSVALKTSLTKLDQAVNNLEAVIESKTQAAADGQIDMFGAVSGGRKSNDNVVDTGALAQKLDSAISKVEKMLAEG